MVRVTIAKQTHPAAVEPVAGPSALVRAAVEAVRQWEFSPSSRPLQVLAGVNFALEANNEPLEPRAFVRITGNVRPPRKVKDVLPVYPADARAAGVEGAVIIEGTLATDGHLRDGCVVGSVPLLDRAAVEAALRWEFTPVLVNGVPTPLMITLTVRFTP